MYTSPLLEGRPGVIQAFSEASDGNMDYRFGERSGVLRNRTKFLKALGLSPDACVQEDALGDTIRIVNQADRSKGMTELETRIEANAFITNQKGIGLFLCVADCLPIVMFDPVQKVVALIHAARVSTGAHLSEKVIAEMTKRYGSKPRDILAVFGPAIQAPSYIFDDNVYNLVNTDWQPYLKRLGPNRVSVDNVGFNRDQLITAGVASAHVWDCGIDTFTSGDYFSHARSQKSGQPEGRFAVIAALS